MLCDPRVISKPYGRRIWQSLPPFRRTRVQADVIEFFREGAEPGSGSKGL
jgi:ATP-dependent DNA helicase DinG